jgi:hypothetical protein
VKKITAATVVLITIGVILAIFSGYNYFTNIHVIAKDQAISIAVCYGGWTQQDLGIGSIHLNTKLLQAKLSNHVALVINTTTMTADPYPVPLRTFNVRDSQFFWEVTIDKQVHPLEFKSWIYEIDATNGTVIQSFTPNG